MLVLYISRSLGYERVCVPRCQMVDTSFHIQGDDNVMLVWGLSKVFTF